MKMKVVIDDPADFKAWLQGEKPAIPPPATGSKVAENNTVISSGTVKI